MEIKVREVSGSHEKSQQEVENELLQKHEEKFEATQPEETIVEKVEVSTPRVKVLSFFLSTGMTTRASGALSAFRLAAPAIGCPAGIISGCATLSE